MFLKIEDTADMANCQILMVKRLFAGTVGINFDYFEKCLHFGPKYITYIKSGFRKNPRWLSETSVKDESSALLTFNSVVI